MLAKYCQSKIGSSTYKLDLPDIVKTVELQYEVPKDANGLFIINPQIDFLEIEIKNLQKFIASGGNLFIALSPRFNEVGFEKFDAFLKSLGIEFVNLIVLDRLAAQQGSQPSIPVISRLEKHEITKGFNGRLLFPISATFRLENDAYTFSTLAKSIPFPGSWGELSFNEVKNGEAHFDEGKDLKGNLPLFVIGENERKMLSYRTKLGLKRVVFHCETENVLL